MSNHLVVDGAGDWAARPLPIPAVSAHCRLESPHSLQKLNLNKLINVLSLVNLSQSQICLPAGVTCA